MMREQTKSILNIPIIIVSTILWVALVLGFTPVAFVWWLCDLSATRLRNLWWGIIQ